MRASDFANSVRLKFCFEVFRKFLKALGFAVRDRRGYWKKPTEFGIASGLMMKANHST